jgi:hypothetical protein
MAATGLNVRNKQTVLVNQSGRVNRKIDNLLDVNTQGKVDGSLLLYNFGTDTFLASNLLDKHTIDGGDF